jgi:hypothetical protein
MIFLPRDRFLQILRLAHIDRAFQIVESFLWQSHIGFYGHLPQHDELI